MKFGQLIEYKMRGIFPEKLYVKCGGGKTITKSFSKKSKLSLSLDQRSKVLFSFILFLLYAKLRAIKIY